MSFVREGLPLSVWLPRLVSEDSTERGTAAAAINAMRHGLPSVHSSLRDIDHSKPFDHSAHQDRLMREMLSAAIESGLDTPDLIRRLCAMELAADQEYGRHIAANRGFREVRDAKYERVAKTLVETINTATDEADRDHASKRLAKLTAAYICDPRKKGDRLAPGTLNGGAIRSLVLEAISSHIGKAPEAVEALLDAPRLRYKGLRVIRSAGPLAIEFAPLLLDRFDSVAASDKPASPYALGEDAQALAAIGRGNAQVVDALIDRLTRIFHRPVCFARFGVL